MHNLYYVEAPTNKMPCDYYNGAIVVADSEEEAKKIHPYHGNEYPWWEDKMRGMIDEWALPEDVVATFVGTTDRYENGDVVITDAKFF